MAGDSAGAHLVSTYCTSLEDPQMASVLRVEGMERPRRVAGLILFYGAYDCETILTTGFPFIRMMMEAFLSRDPALFKERAMSASPIRHISPAYPPCFITYAQKDKLASESVAFVRELEARGVEHVTMPFPPSDCRIIPHGFMNLFWRRSARRAMAAAVAFLDRYAKE
jgi:acetyl esterase/lipase